MKKYIDNNFNTILMIFILINPILDLITSFSIRFFDNNFSIGMVIRGLFFAFLIIYYFILNKGYKNKIMLSILSFILLYLIAFTINKFYYEDINSSMLFNEYKNMFKIFYTPIILLIPLLCYTASIGIADITNTAFDSYAHSKTGHIGWFYAANEIGAIIAIVMPFLFMYLFQKNKLMTKIILVLFVLFAIFIMGTKTPILSIVLIAFSYFILYIYKIFKKKVNIKKILIPLGVFIAFIIVLPFTTFFNNIVTDYKFLKANNIVEIITSPQKLDHIVFGLRGSLWQDSSKIYNDKPISTKILGMGFINDRKEEPYKLVEIDPVDTYYCCGPFIFILLYSIMPFLLIKEIVINRKKINENYIPYLQSLILGIFIACTAGHVFSAPSVGIYFIIIYVMMLSMLYGKEVKKK